MTLTTLTNAILMIGVTIMVVAPLLWAIRTQHRDPSGTVTAAPAPAASRMMHQSADRHRPSRTLHGGAARRRSFDGAPSRTQRDRSTGRVAG